MSRDTTSARWLRRFRWAPLPVGIGVAYMAYQQYWHKYINKPPRVPHVWPEWRIRLMTSLPLRATSRAFGRICRCYLPQPLRRPVLGLFAYHYNCNMAEAVEESFDSYETMSDFFNRELKPEYRPISESLLVSPADSVVHRCGRLKDGRIEQVKGIDYDVDEFLGQLSARDDNNNEVSVPRPPSTNRMYYCTLYLAPGDYHAFHSPADWTPIFRRHFPGLLLSVRSTLLERIPKLFCLNERVCLLGKWRHGFFSMTAVAATNVGNMQLEMVGLGPFNISDISLQDPTLHTNVSGADLHSHNDRVLDEPDAEKLERGAKVGKFKLGSTIVLVFEAPEKFRFCATAGDRLNFGQSLGFVVPDDAPP